MTLNKIYIDMDGVLADFDEHFYRLYKMQSARYEAEFGPDMFWDKIYETPRFFETMPPTMYFQNIVDKAIRHSDCVVILSSPSRTNQSLCIAQKRNWIDRFLGRDFPAIFESKKHKYSRPDRLLIDDTLSKCNSWAKRGGLAHHYTDYNSFQSYMNTF